MDRIMDSGSIDWGSTPHGRTTYLDSIQRITRSGICFGSLRRRGRGRVGNPVGIRNSTRCCKSVSRRADNHYPPGVRSANVTGLKAGKAQIENTTSQKTCHYGKLGKDVCGKNGPAKPNFHCPCVARYPISRHANSLECQAIRNATPLADVDADQSDCTDIFFIS